MDGRMADSVVVSCGGNFHSYHVVRAAWRAGLLRSFITARHRPREVRPPTDLIVHHPVPAYVRHGIAHLPACADILPGSLIGDGLYDRLAATSLPPEFDVLHVFAAYGFLTGRRAKAMGAATVLDTGSAHILDQEKLLRRAYYDAGLAGSAMNARWVTKQVVEAEEADRILVPSAFAYRSYVSRGFSTERLRLVPYGVDTSEFTLPQPEVERGGLIFVGNVSLMKGMLYLLRAAKGLRLEPRDLLLLGNVMPDARPVLLRYHGHYAQMDNIPHSQVPEFLKRARALVLPSVQEGSGMVVTEALACGTPVIVTDNVGAADFVTPGINGLVVSPFDVESLMSAMSTMLDDDDRWHEMSMHAGSTRLRRWDVEYANDLVDVWRSMVG